MVRKIGFFGWNLPVYELLLVTCGRWSSTIATLWHLHPHPARQKEMKELSNIGRADVQDTLPETTMKRTMALGKTISFTTRWFCTSIFVGERVNASMMEPFPVIPTCSLLKVSPHGGKMGHSAKMVVICCEVLGHCIR